MGYPSESGRPRRKRMGSRIARLSVLTLALLGLPLLGVALQGKPISQYLEFPPKSRYVTHAPFSWLAFWAFAAVTAGLVAPFVHQYLRTRSTLEDKIRPPANLSVVGLAGFGVRPCSLGPCMDAFFVVFGPPAPHLYAALALLHPGGQRPVMAAEGPMPHDSSAPVLSSSVPVKWYFLVVF